MYKHRKQIYKSKRELLLALIQLAYLEKKEQCKSRSFYYEQIETKKFYECKFQFENNEIVSFSEKESETAFGEVDYTPSKPKKYRLRSYEHYDNFGIGYDTRDQVIEELKQHEGQRYTLEVDNNENRIFVKYENGYLICDEKKYKI